MTQQIVISTVGQRGPAGLIWKDGWSANGSYVRSDAVTVDGSSYRCVGAHSSNTDTRPGTGELWETYWSVVAAGAAAQPDEETPTIGSAPQVVYTGEFTRPWTVKGAIPVEVLTLPSNTIVRAEGLWAEEIYFDEHSGIETLSFPDLVGVMDDFSFSECSDLTSVSAPLLEYVEGNFYFYNNPVTILDFPTLRIANDYFEINDLHEIEIVSFPELVSIRYYFYLTDCSSLQMALFPSLETAGAGVNIRNNPLVESIEFSSLKTIHENLYVEDMSGLVSFSLPVIEVLGSIYVSGNTNSLTTFSLGESLRELRWDVEFYSGALDQESVDHILEVLVSLDGTEDTVLYENRTVRLDAENISPPSDFVNVGVLRGRGCNVYVNGED